MIGLRRYERDAQLPERLGDQGMRVLSSEELCALVSEQLLRPDAPPVDAAELCYARWKPGVALTTVHELRFADGASTLVSVKQHRGGKIDSSAVERAASVHVLRAQERLLPLAVVPGRDLFLWSFPADRVLKGAARAADPRRMARVIEDWGLFSDSHVRGRGSRSVLLRYKPERRAIFRFEAVAGFGADKQEKPFLLRALDPELCDHVLARRRQVERPDDELLPRLLWSDPTLGLMLEEWCEGRASAPQDFTHARRAGSSIAQLHRRLLGGSVEDMERGWADVEQILGRDARLARLLEQCPPRSARRRECCIHGDFHPDQMLLDAGTGRCVLIDLDALRPGEPAEDLASWIADRLVAEPSLRAEDASAELLLGYAEAGGCLPDAARIGELVAEELVLRAAASLRRLEQGAVEKAAGCLERALAMRARGGARS